MSAPSIKSTKPAKTRVIDLQNVPVTELKGVGPKLAEKLAGIHVYNVLDLLFHLPFRYQDRTRITPIGSLKHGMEAVIEGDILGSAVVYGRRRSLLVKVQDGTGIISLRFYHFSAAQKNNLQDGARIRCFGEGRWGKSGIELYHPEYEILGHQDKAMAERLTPIYPTTEGLHQARLRTMADQALAMLAKSRSLPDLLPPALSQELKFISLEDALGYLHRPPVNVSLNELEAGTHPAQARLAFEELLANYLCLRRLREAADKHAAPPLPQKGELTNQMLDALAFTLTKAQQRVGKEIARDMAKPTPMLRLVQGDVGSGKTLVAVLAALQAIEHGFQAAIMAPTEILAEQHYLNFEQLLRPLGLDVVFLSGKIKGKQRDTVMQAMQSGQAQLIVGTHALFQDEVAFAKLGLIVVDEQHRFGVHQRLALREKGSSANESGKGNTYPHQLIMTATPIPRTLTMSAYADLDCSIIDELPPGRTPVNTILSSDTRRGEIIERIRNACADGKQAYWVCTLIEESETLQLQAAEATYAEMQLLLKGIGIGLIHGRLKPKEKAGIMHAFKQGELQLLIATTVIEVGVDVPNASLMVIENPERLGLAQLHQLRGRVGRGRTESHCVLLYKAPLSDIAKERLSIMRQSNDGFFIAEKDLEIRGPGEVLGTRQTGLMEFKLADLMRDAHLQPKIKLWAEQIRAECPDLIEPLIKRWLAGSEQYGHV
jgi:ATP-dependent DNA helicase RecG